MTAPQYRFTFRPGTVARKIAPWIARMTPYVVSSRPIGYRRSRCIGYQNRMFSASERLRTTAARTAGRWCQAVSRVGERSESP